MAYWAIKNLELPSTLQHIQNGAAVEKEEIAALSLPPAAYAKTNKTILYIHINISK